MLRIISWNVNGLRSVVKKGFLAWLQASGADIVCLQETRVDEAQVPEEVRAVPGYFCHFVAGEKKGYSGVGMLSRIPPREIASGIGIPRFDGDGRIQVAQFEGFRLYNIYFPNGKMGPERLQFKMDFYEAFLAAVDPLVKKGERLVVVGDFNTAHREIDLARPKENSKVS
jgi:exodeoxyribonuclease-3